MKYFDGNCYSNSVFHDTWKHALQEYGKGMDDSCPVDQRKDHLKTALQILRLVPDSTNDEGVSLDDIYERERAISYIEDVLYEI